MIGKNIKTVIDASGMSYSQVADMLDITYQYLFKIFNKDSVETRYLFEIAKILNIPVVKFFEGEPGGISPVINVNDLQLKIEKLTKRVNELEKSLEKSEELIEFYKDRINELVMGIVSYKFFLPEDTSLDLTFYGPEYEELFKKVGYSKEKTDYVLKILSESKVKIDPK